MWENTHYKFWYLYSFRTWPNLTNHLLTCLFMLSYKLLVAIWSIYQPLDIRLLIFPFIFVHSRCCMQEECPGSPWISISKDAFQKELISFQMVSVTPGEVNVIEWNIKTIYLFFKKYTVLLGFSLLCLCFIFIFILSIVVHSQINLNLHLYLDARKSLPLTCTFQAGSGNLCSMSSPVADFPKCFCNFTEKLLSSDGQYFHCIPQTCVGHITFYRLSKETKTFFMIMCIEWIDFAYQYVILLHFSRTPC